MKNQQQLCISKCHPESEHLCEKKNWVPLNTTMYVYHCKPERPKDVAKRLRKNRTETICHTSNKITPSKAEVHNRTNNLQTILKMK